MRQALVCLILLAIGSVLAQADQYWIAYEGNDFPEKVGWMRTYGDGNDPPQDQPDRWLEDGVLVIDTSRDGQLWEYYSIHRPIDPGPDESFVAQWRVRCDLLSGIHDAGVVIARDEPAGHVGLHLTSDSLEISGEDTSIPITPGELHTYRLESSNMIMYRLFIDNELVHSSAFRPSILESYVAFGPGTQGARSVTYWDYFRFGVVPEPHTGLLFSLGLLARRNLQ